MDDESLEDLIEVTRGELETWHQALTMAFSASLAQDLAASYRELRVDTKHSKLTNSLRNNLEIMESYLFDTEEEDDGLEESVG